MTRPFINRQYQSDPSSAEPTIPENPATRMWRWCRRNPLIAGLAVVACLALGFQVVQVSRVARNLRHARQEAEEKRARAEQDARGLRDQLDTAEDVARRQEKEAEQ